MRRVRLPIPTSRAEVSRIADVLRNETLGGILLLAATVIALTWANSPWSSGYDNIVGYQFGPETLQLRLSAAHWASDGLLAIFFFVAGLELKHEFVAGELRDPRRAAVPVVAAAGGVIVPAVIYLAIAGESGRSGWAIPTATDIAFALALLAVAGARLPGAMRTFLLTLAVVDDLVAIVIIAFIFTDDLDIAMLALAIAPLAAFGWLAQRGIGGRTAPWWLLLPLALTTWAMVHACGIHATVAGVLLAFTVPVRATGTTSPAHRFEHVLRPISAGLAVPVFAFFSAGVAIGGLAGLGTALSDRIAIGIVAALVLGKTIGVLGATWLVTRFTRADLHEELAWADMAALAVLCGVGFTVSLLIAELAFASGTQAAHAKVAVLAGSLLAALLATTLLRARTSVHRRAGTLAGEPSSRSAS